jgi:hypothetical protein
MVKHVLFDEKLSYRIDMEAADGVQSTIDVRKGEAVERTILYVLNGRSERNLCQ